MVDLNEMDIAKKAAAKAAAHMIEDGMVVGLGTGSTARFFVEALSKRCHQGLEVLLVATSEQTALQAKQLGLVLQDSSEVSRLDVTVDGADEIDLHKNMIKGAGGALLREKILAKSSREVLVIVDETKLVSSLGKHPLPVEISSFLFQSTLKRLSALGNDCRLRLNSKGGLYVTDNGNYIVDIQYSELIEDPAREQYILKNILGVVETGLFFNTIGKVIIGYRDGSFKLRI